MTKIVDKNNLLKPVTLGFAIFLWSSLFVWQGIDFTDLGYITSACQQFYDSPASHSNSLIIWFTFFIGHWLCEPIGGTIVTYKLGCSLILCLTGVISYLFLAQNFGHKWIAAFFIFVSFIFLTHRCGNWINYNNLTAFFYVLCVTLLFISFRFENQLILFISAFIIGVNLFVRFPNIIGFLFVLTIPFNGYISKWNKTKTSKWILLFTIGWLCGLCSVLLLIYKHGHFKFFAQSLIDLFSNSVKDDRIHSGSSLIKMFLLDHFIAFILASLVLVVGIPITNFITSRLSTKLQIFCSLFFAISLAFLFSFSDSWKWLIPGLVYYSLFFVLFKSIKQEPSLSLLSLLVLFAFLFIPLGSGNGIRNAIYGYWLALPTMFMLLWLGFLGEIRIFNKFITPNSARFILCSLLITLTCYSLYKSWSFSYRDHSNRLLLTKSINHPLLYGSFTTNERAKVVSELLNNLSLYVKRGDFLLAYPDIPTLHYLTRTKPWLHCSWPNILDDTRLIRSIKQNHEISLTLPIVVRTIGSTKVSSWPVNSSLSENSTEYNALDVLDSFVESNFYNVVWSNEFFEILSIN